MTRLRPGATRYAYDAQGNQRTETSGSGTRTFDWNARNQLAKVTQPNGASSGNAYAGPGNQQRIKEGTTATVNDALGLAASGTQYLTRGDQGQFLSQRSSSAAAPNRRLYPLADALGSVRALTDENGIVVKRYAYHPYGRDAGMSGTGPHSILRFAAGEIDTQGLYHFGARFYDATQGRWTQRDPLNQAADVRQANRYAYVGGDPVNLTDPRGEYSSTARGRRRTALSNKETAVAVVVTCGALGLVPGGAVVVASIACASGFAFAYT